MLTHVLILEIFCMYDLCNLYIRTKKEKVYLLVNYLTGVYSHRTFSYRHVEILYDMIWIFAAAVDLEGMSDADRLLAIPGGVVQTWSCQNSARSHCRQVHVAVRVVALHSRRVRETFGVRTTVAAIKKRACQ